MRQNRLRELWRAGRPATNCWLSLGHAFTTEMISHQGWDSVTIDMQHGLATHAELCSMLAAISTTDTVPLARITWNDPGSAMRSFDAGAYGVICPNVESREECERFVGACRYAPQGYRSVGPLRAPLYAGPDYVRHANATLLAIVQVETKKGLDNVEEIVAVDGLDMLYVGPFDLGLSLGRESRGDPTDSVVVAAIDRILAAAKRADRQAGIYCNSAEYAKQMMEKGFDLVTVTSDQAMIAAGAAVARQFK